MAQLSKITKRLKSCLTGGAGLAVAPVATFEQEILARYLSVSRFAADLLKQR